MTITLDKAESPSIADINAERLENEIGDIGQDIFEETPIDNDTGGEPVFDYGPMLDPKDLRQIQQDIAKTKRPTWQSGPPTDFGTPAHGKLKADEWRTSIEFDLVVSLIKLWQSDEPDNTLGNPHPGNLLQHRRNKVIHSTMLLAMAVRWGTSNRT